MKIVVKIGIALGICSLLTLILCGNPPLFGATGFIVSGRPEADMPLRIDELKPGMPNFCFTTGLFNEQHPTIYFLNVTQVDGHGKKLKSVWLVQCFSNQRSDCQLQNVQYGIVPHGWTQLQPPVKIEDDCFYAVNWKKFFKRTREGKYVVLSSQAFFHQCRR
jgi:hypothetical protein